MEKDVSSFYDTLGSKYIDWEDQIAAKYHDARFRTATGLIERHVDEFKAVFDFGCGSGDFIEGLAKFETIKGCDVSPEMVRLAKARAIEAGIVATLEVGGLDMFLNETGPFDIVVALGVTGYLSKEEERKFIDHAHATLQAGGLLLLTHVNELFDLVTFNRYTVDFYKDIISSLELDIDPSELSALLTHPDAPYEGQQASERDKLRKRRVDPFVYPGEVEAFGYDFLEMRGLNCFPLPPLILNKSPERTLLQLGLHEKITNPTLEKLFCSHFMAVFRKAE